MARKSTVKVRTFADALKSVKGKAQPHLLLGNGFSIACRKDIFRYDALFEQADFKKISKPAKASFAKLKTTDFEKVIRRLRDCAVLMDVYGKDPAVAKAMRADAEALKNLLVETIAASHPARPSEITDREYAACQAFLDRFKCIYTFNYDLLLYWSKMHYEDPSQIESDDGFRPAQSTTGDIEEDDYVVWEPGQSHDQNMWFLHGALHVFDSGTEIQKYTWSRTGVRLIEQVQNALNKDFFPLFVAEGTSDEKLERIRHSDYLAKAYRSFQQIRGCLFIYGHSLAENDEHYLRLIADGKLGQLYVGLFGDPASDDNRRIIKRAQSLAAARNRSSPLEVEFYDSASAKVWG